MRINNRIMINGPFLFLDGKLLNAEKHYIDELKYPFEQLPHEIAYEIYDIKKDGKYTYSFLIIPPKLVGGFFIKSNTHYAKDVEYVQLVSGRGAILSHKQNSDFSFDVKTGVFSQLETVKLKDEYYCLYNFSTSSAVFFMKYVPPWKNNNFEQKNEGEAFFFKSDDTKTRNTNFLISRINVFETYNKDLISELEDLL